MLTNHFINKNGAKDRKMDRKMDRNTRWGDSHLQSWLDPRSPPVLLPWQPDRRLGGGGRNEFLSLDRCRRCISATLFRLNDLLHTRQPDERQCSSAVINVTEPVFLCFIKGSGEEWKVCPIREEFCAVLWIDRGAYWDAGICPNVDTHRWVLCWISHRFIFSSVA